MIFPYMRLRGKDLPIIPLMLRGEKEWIEYDAFMDSGAGYSVFHYDVVEDLGLDIRDMDKRFVTVSDGSLIIVYKHLIKIKIGQIDFGAEIGFSKQLGIGFNILGRNDIFDKFRICFEKKKKILEISPIE